MKEHKHHWQVHTRVETRDDYGHPMLTVTKVFCIGCGETKKV